MMTQEQMEAEIIKLKIANDEIKETISEMQRNIRKTASLLDLIAGIVTPGK